MKNLANCNGVEFLTQTNKIRHAVEGWLKETGILEIRKTSPKYLEIKDDMSDEKKSEVLQENERRKKEQAKKNLSAMLDAALEKDAEKTFEVLAMMCFLEPKEAKETVKASELLLNFAEMIADEGVIGFFSLLKQSGLVDFFAESVE